MTIQASRFIPNNCQPAVRFGGKTKPDHASTGTDAPSATLLDKPAFRREFTEAIKLNSVHVKPNDVVPIRSMPFHMWLLPSGELRQIPDMEHEQMAKKLYQTLQLRGSTFLDDDGTRFRERAIVEAGVVKVCSHDGQLQIAMPVDVTEAQTRLLYSLSRIHANEKLAWDILGAEGQVLSSYVESTPLSWRLMMPTLRATRTRMGI